LKVLRVNEELGDKDKTGIILWELGDVLSDGGKYAEALVYHQQALRIWEVLERKEDGREKEREDATARTLVKIGCDYGYLGQYAKAQENLFKALEMYGVNGNRTLRFVCLNYIGYFYNRNGQFREAQPYLLQSLRLQIEVRGKGNYERGMNTLNNLAVSYRGQEKFDSALTFARKALAIADSTHFKKSEKEALEELVNIMESLGRPKEALAYYKRYTAVKDSLINLESLNKTAELKEGYEAEKREQQITLLNNERALQESEISRRTAVQWSLAGILAVVVAGSIWLGALYRQKNAANKAILRQQALLEDQAHEIHQANIELHQQNEELAALNIEKNEMMGIVSHDLKNPIGAVRGYAELIQSGVFEGEEVLGVAGQITQVSERMLELVKNLLDMNLLESGGLQLHILSFDVAPLVESAVTQYRTPAEAKNITLHFSNETSDGESIVSADERATMQVLDNLVSNAVKYSPHGKRVFVRVLSDKTVVKIEVQDEGQGISPEDMKKLFGKFQRLSALPTGGEHSTGLGLSIVKKIVEAMNGKVWCESVLGEGATFIVELPKAR
jgi:signal transduction histidine kinase